MLARKHVATAGRFMAVGGTGAVVNNVSLLLLYKFVHLPLVAAAVLAAELAIANNFVWNSRWTFGQTRLSAGRFLRFNVVSLVGVALATSVLWLLVERLGCDVLVGNMVGIGAATAWNYAGSVGWTWRHS